jgi:hypothetical protein
LFLVCTPGSREGYMESTGYDAFQQADTQADTGPDRAAAKLLYPTAPLMRVRRRLIISGMMVIPFSLSARFTIIIWAT